MNNAGVYRFAPVDDFAEDEFHRLFDTNVLGPLLTIQAAVKQFGDKGGSIINVSSVAHTRARPDFSNLNAEREFVPYDAYALSKLANVLFTMELARRLPADEVTANCCHPGAIRSGFASKEDTSGPERIVIAVDVKDVMVAFRPGGIVHAPGPVETNV